MTSTEERAVAAMRAIGDTVTGAPPLRLPPSAAAARSTRFTRLGRAAGRAWRLWLVPAAAAAAVVALAVSLVLVRSAPHRPPLASPSGSATAGPGGVPEYYVQLLPHQPVQPGSLLSGPAGQIRGGKLVIAETATNKSLDTVAPPRGLTFNVLSGAADDRTFVVGATSYVPGEKTVSTLWFETWYLLRIAPGTAHVARLTRLPGLELPSVTGVAISPDGTQLAVAYQQFSGPSWSSATGRPQLALLSVATGRELDHWSSTQGSITATPPAAGTASRPSPYDTPGLASALRWTPDGGGLAFAWNGAQIRLLDFTAQGPRQQDLVKASRVRALIGAGSTLDGPSYTCDAGAGWSLSTGGRTVTCPGSFTPGSLANVVPRQTAPAGGAACTRAAPAHPAFVQRTALSDGGMAIRALAQSPACVSAGSSSPVAALGWASADGSTVIGMLNAGAVIPSYGIFTRHRFVMLPSVALSNSLLAWVAW